MISSSKTYNYLLVAFILCLGFIPSPYRINVFGLDMNMDRLIIMIGFVVTFLIFLQGKNSVKKIQLILFAYLLIVLLNNFLIGNLQLMSIYVALLLFFLSSDILKEESYSKALAFSFIGLTAWTLYSIFFFFSTGQALIEVPFANFLPSFMETKLEHAELVAASYSIFPRISFPYASPPQLSAVAGLFFLFFFYQFQMRNTEYKSLSITYSLMGMIASIGIVIATISRTGLAVIAAGLFFYYLFSLNLRLKVSSLLTTSFYALILFGLGFLTLNFFSDNLIANAITSRFTSGDDFSALNPYSHLNIRLMGIEYFFDMSFFEKLFGIGYLNYEVLHFHSSLLTALIEIGIFGFALILLALCYPLKKAFQLLGSLERKEIEQGKFVISLIMALIVAHLAYELPYIQFLWIFWGYAFCITLSEKKESLHDEYA